jgi:hypothetical protein
VTADRVAAPDALTRRAGDTRRCRGVDGNRKIWKTRIERAS